MNATSLLTFDIVKDASGKHYGRIQGGEVYYTPIQGNIARYMSVAEDIDIEEIPDIIKPDSHNVTKG